MKVYHIEFCKFEDGFNCDACVVARSRTHAKEVLQDYCSVYDIFKIETVGIVPAKSGICKTPRVICEEAP